MNDEVTIFKNAQFPTLGNVDVHVSDGVITSITPTTTSTSGPSQIDADGWLLLPPLVEPHAHLDKAFLSERIDNPSGDLMGAICGIESARTSLTREDTIVRAERAVRQLANNGVQLVRSHADTTTDTELQNVEALLEVKQRCADIVELQVAALVGWPLSGQAGADNRALARAAVAAGADVIGGCPHLDENPAEALRFLFELANELDVALDLHADENTRPDSRDLELCADMVISSGSTINIAASHCVALGCQPEDAQHRVAEKVAQARVSVIALPLTNLYLQGRDVTHNVLRGLTPVNLLRSHGVNVAAGGDNLQDPFNPLGKGDPLETATFMVLAGHTLIEDAFASVTHRASTALAVAPVDISVGSSANFLLIKSTSVRDALATQTHQRMVVRHGRVLSARL